MPPSPLEVVDAILHARRAGNIVQMNALCAPAFAFTFNADPDRVGDGTTVIGWDAIQAHLGRVKATWQEESRDLLGITGDDFHPERVHVHFAFRLRHRASQHLLEGTKRMIFVVRDGIAMSCEEIFDPATVHTVQRMAALRQAADAPAGEAPERAANDPSNGADTLPQRLS